MINSLQRTTIPFTVTNLYIHIPTTVDIRDLSFDLGIHVVIKFLLLHYSMCLHELNQSKLPGIHAKYISANPNIYIYIASLK